MTVEIDDLAVWLPGRGIAIGPVSLAVEGVTVVTGRSGAGASTLAAAIGGCLPVGALARGSWSAGVKIHHVAAQRPRPDGDESVAESLGTNSPLAHELWSAVTGQTDLEVALRELPLATRAAMPALRGVLRAMADRTARGDVLLVLDQPLTHLTADLRRALGRVFRRCADAGVDVCWVEHDLAVAVPLADRVVELLDDGAPLVHASQSWVPRTLPLPPEAALARLLGLPRDAWWDLEKLRSDPGVRAAVPLAYGAGAGISTANVSVAAARSQLPFDLDVVPGETLGIVPGVGSPAFALSVARRIAASMDDEPGPRSALRWPEHVPVRQLMARWCRARGGDPAAALALAGRLAAIDPSRTLAQHSSGECRAVHWALSTVSTRTEVLEQPEAGLDAHGRRALASELAEGGRTTTIVVSHDPEFLVRACHRLVVLPDPKAVSRTEPVFGPPALVADHMVHRPVLRALGSRALRVGDVRGGLR